MSKKLIITKSNNFELKNYSRYSQHMNSTARQTQTCMLRQNISTPQILTYELFRHINYIDVWTSYVISRLNTQTDPKIEFLHGYVTFLHCKACLIAFKLFVSIVLFYLIFARYKKMSVGVLKIFLGNFIIKIIQ